MIVLNEFEKEHIDKSMFPLSKVDLIYIKKYLNNESIGNRDIFDININICIFVGILIQSNILQDKVLFDCVNKYSDSRSLSESNLSIIRMYMEEHNIGNSSVKDTIIDVIDQMTDNILIGADGFPVEYVMTPLQILQRIHLEKYTG